MGGTGFNETRPNCRILYPVYSNLCILLVNSNCFVIYFQLHFSYVCSDICLYIWFYYIDMSVLPKNRQLVFSIQTYLRDTSEIFSISSLVKISLTSFLCFSFVFCIVFFLFLKHSYLCNKMKITRWFEHMKFIFSWKKDFTWSLCSPVRDFFHSKINFICSCHCVISSIYMYVSL